MRLSTATLLLLVAAPGFAASSSAPTDDPYQWLEAIDDPKALAWVAGQNAATARRLSALPDYAALYRDARSVLEAASRLPEISAHGGYLYNLWRDAAHPRGLYRRTTPAEFRRPEPRWETVLDVDALAAKEGKPWAFGGTVWRESDGRRCLIRLAPGGTDAAEVREFDPEKLAFVPDGFVVPVAKTRVTWDGPDALLIGTDFGPGTLTPSGYPCVLKRWRRGTPLAAATTLREAGASSVGMNAHVYEDADAPIDVVTEELTFWTSRHWQLVDGRLQQLAIPATATIADVFRGKFILRLKEDWRYGEKEFAAGSVVAADPAAFRGGAGTVDLVVAPTPVRVVTHVEATKTGLLIAFLDNVRGRLDRFVPTAQGWTQGAVALPDNGTVEVMTVSHDTGEAYLQFETFLSPPTLYLLPAGASEPQSLKAQAPTFDGSRFAVEQYWTSSADGTRIPYFVVHAKSWQLDGRNPVWMFSYGGFETSLTPAYSGSYEQLYGAYGKLWLERGGVFVLPNIRGGGEFGPQWHLSALKANHVKAFEDFEAVARDLVARKITTPAHLGIEGRSNGGLLVASTMLRHPELYGAVVCGSPLLDMRRYHRLLAGASWMAEYGNPDDPAEWAFLSTYSPYQNIHAGMHLPPVMFYTSTRDDRVHPGHARKMAAKMEDLGYPVEYYEIVEGGHHASVTSEQLATRLARTYAFLWEHVR